MRWLSRNAYHTGLSAAPNQETDCTHELLHNKVMDAFKRHGYTIYQLSSGWVATGSPMPQTDCFYTARTMNKFSIQLTQTSFLRLFITDLFETSSAYIRYNLKILRELPALDGPKFVFAHIICPHPPFVFTRTGALAPRPRGIRRLESDWLPKERYIDQLYYVTEAVKRAVSAIRTRSKIDPIIIVQSDHGPALPGLSDTPDPDIVYTRTSILSAFYLPGINTEKWLYPTMTPVNTFRTILNAYFDDQYELLPNKSYFSGPIGASPYVFHDVTDMHP